MNLKTVFIFEISIAEITIFDEKIGKKIFNPTIHLIGAPIKKNY